MDETYKPVPASIAAPIQRIRQLRKAVEEHRAAHRDAVYLVCEQVLHWRQAASPTRREIDAKVGDLLPRQQLDAVCRLRPDAALAELRRVLEAATS